MVGGAESPNHRFPPGPARYEEIARGIHREEYEEALELARVLGLRLDPRSVGERRHLAHAL
ncbi:MAG TPA: hypothetical protein VLA69_05015 [Gaiellaceae bacterium]|nr:hypothetical protein [Gaiellaceae bacterium]